jgi:hypothetical protein
MPAVDKLARWVRRRKALAVSACLALSVSLAGMASGPQPAAAAPRPAPLTRAALAPSASNEEEGEEGGGGSEGEEPEEQEQEEESEAATLPPTECLLRSAAARVVTSTPHDSVSLTVRYTSYAPSEVSVDYWLKGGRGSLQLGKARERFAEKGLLRLSEHLSARAMAKAQAARAFIVSLDVPAAPPLCDRYAIRRLTVRRPTGGQIDWLTPGSSAEGSR